MRSRYSCSLAHVRAMAALRTTASMSRRMYAESSERPTIFAVLTPARMSR